MLSTLQEEFYSLSSTLAEYRVPLKVNGKDVADKQKSDLMLEEIKKLDCLQRDIILLKSLLAKVNVTTILNNKTLNNYLEEVRIKRNYLLTLKNLLRMNSTKVENGVGVVQYGVLNENYIRKSIVSLEKEVTEMSQKIDIANSNTYFEIELSTEF
ncbi:MAG: hypothetical protein IJG31_04995 [Fusobacterium sp.]|nr:hypothetical protein [Fusobacterium sp.]